MEANYTGVFCDNTISTGESVCLTAVGTSMWPIITKGMRAVITPLNSGLPPVGSLVLIKRANAIVVHRYWGLTHCKGVPLVLTKGDTNLAFDPPVPAAMILGQVSLLQKKSGVYCDPNRGWLYLAGRMLCSSYKIGRAWARLCRLMMRFGC